MISNNKITEISGSYWEVGTRVRDAYLLYYTYDSSWSTRDLAIIRTEELKTKFEEGYNYYKGIYWKTQVDNTSGKFLTKITPHHHDIIVELDDIELNIIKRFITK